MAHVKINDKGQIVLKNVRLAFPSLFKKASFEGKEGKFEATFLMPKEVKKDYDTIIAQIEECKTANKIKVPESKYFIQDGDDKDYDGFEDNYAIKAGNNKRPTVLNRDRTPLVEEDEVVYAGCYVNAIIDPWAQNNQYGKRINANLLGVQFVKDGDPFTEGGKTSDVDDFDDMEDEDDL